VNGYESRVSDIAYLFDVASADDRTKVVSMVYASVIKEDDRDRFFDHSGCEISLDEIHRRTQEDPAIQRSVYNLWMTYAH
jgi:hypothetical protein